MCGVLTHVKGLTTRTWPPSSPEKIRSAKPKQNKAKHTEEKFPVWEYFEKTILVSKKETPKSETTPSDGNKTSIEYLSNM